MELIVPDHETDIDLDSLFNDPKNVSEFNISVPDMAIQNEINQVLTNALAEINENHLETLTGSHKLSDDRHIKIKGNSYSQDNEVKPLSPESLLSGCDDSNANSPNERRLFHFPDQESELMKTNSELINKNLEMTTEIEILKKALHLKSTSLGKAMSELKKSEITRFQLMEENRELKKIVSKLVLNDQ